MELTVNSNIRGWVIINATLSTFMYYLNNNNPSKELSLPPARKMHRAHGRQDLRRLGCPFTQIRHTGLIISIIIPAGIFLNFLLCIGALTNTVLTVSGEQQRNPTTHTPSSRHLITNLSTKTNICQADSKIHMAMLRA